MTTRAIWKYHRTLRKTCKEGFNRLVWVILYAVYDSLPWPIEDLAKATSEFVKMRDYTHESRAQHAESILLIIISMSEMCLQISLSSHMLKMR